MLAGVNNENAGTRTDFESLRSLAIYVTNHLHEKRLIEYAAENRAALVEALATELSVSFSTDEDIRDQAIEEVEDKLGKENLPEDITETEMFNHARKEIVKSFQGESLAGLYMVESLNQLAHRVKDFLLANDLVEEVYAMDEELIDFIVTRVRHYQPPKKTIQ